jgi:hypothetical protein
MLLVEPSPPDVNLCHVEVDRAGNGLGARAASVLDEEAIRGVPQLEIGAVDQEILP